MACPLPPPLTPGSSPHGIKFPTRHAGTSLVDAIARRYDRRSPQHRATIGQIIGTKAKQRQKIVTVTDLRFNTIGIAVKGRLTHATD